MPFAWEMYRGDTRRFNLTVTRAGGAENLTGSILRFTAKLSQADAYVDAQIAKSSDIGEGGGITITNAAAGLATVQIDPDDTADITAARRLFCDIELETPAGDIETLDEGSLHVKIDVTNPAP